MIWLNTPSFGISFPVYHRMTFNAPLKEIMWGRLLSNGWRNLAGVSFSESAKNHRVGPELIAQAPLQFGLGSIANSPLHILLHSCYGGNVMSFAFVFRRWVKDKKCRKLKVKKKPEFGHWINVRKSTKGQQTFQNPSLQSCKVAVSRNYSFALRQHCHSASVH